MKDCFASRNIVVHRVKLFCVAKHCCAPRNIVLYHKKLLSTVKDCFVSRNIVVHRVKLFCITKNRCVSSSILSCVLPLWATVVMGPLLQIYVTLSGLIFKFVTARQDGKSHVLFYFILFLIIILYCVLLVIVYLCALT